jgi:hypothetical protein
MKRDVFSGAVGVAAGLLISICPVPLLLLVLPAMLVIFLARPRNLSFRSAAVTTSMTCVVLVVCYQLPVKYLDVKVGPISYEHVTLAELCRQLQEDHGIICHVPDASDITERLSFSTYHPLSRRDILQRLSETTRRPLHVRYCATSATILFGAYPSFTYLGPVMRPAHESRPVSTATHDRGTNH